MKVKITLLAIAMLSLCFVNAQETTETKFGKGILNVVAKDSSWSMKFATRMQFLSTTGWDINDGDYSKPETNFLVRRARLKFGGFAASVFGDFLGNGGGGGGGAFCCVGRTCCIPMLGVFKEGFDGFETFEFALSSLKTI